ncbi:MAG TPA: HAMP domain-containing sensor histidine kinase [Polyangiaceae bacterium]
MKTLHEGILENLREAVVVTDADEKIVLINRAARELGVDVRWLLRQEALVYGRGGLTEVHAADSMGTPRRLAIESKREGDHVVFVIRDLTVTSVKNDALAIDAHAVHDFNNLLTALVTASSMLRKTVEPGGRSDALAGEVQGIAERATSLVRRVLGAARTRRDLRPFDVAEAVREMSELLQRMATHHDVNVDATTSGFVLVDRERFEHVVMNLVANARDATPAGGTITIATALVKLDDAAYVAVTVMDNGAGMSREIRERIFEPFFTTKPKGEGTGLGLPSARRFASDSGGAIAVHSELHQGTAVVLYLPVMENGWGVV